MDAQPPTVDTGLQGSALCCGHGFPCLACRTSRLCQHDAGRDFVTPGCTLVGILQQLGLVVPHEESKGAKGLAGWLWSSIKAAAAVLYARFASPVDERRVGELRVACSFE